jgi:hypothetical protein
VVERRFKDVLSNTPNPAKRMKTDIQFLRSFRLVCWSLVYRPLPYPFLWRGTSSVSRRNFLVLKSEILQLDITVWTSLHATKPNNAAALPEPGLCMPEPNLVSN